MISDRMTPEFKLNNEDFIRAANYRDSRNNSSNFPIGAFDDNDLSPRMESLLFGMPSKNSTRKNSGIAGNRDRTDSLNFPLGLLQSPPVHQLK
jgi:hypothetical protein